MNFSDEDYIRQAIRHGDDQALALYIERMPVLHRDFYRIRQVVDDAGGSRYCQRNMIQMGSTTIRNHWGKAEVEDY